MATKDFNVRIGQEEIGHILNRKENLDHHSQLWTHMSRYRTLGWDLTVTTGQGADLGWDLEQPQENGWKRLADLGLDGVQVNLALRTGRPSRLLVLEVTKGEGTLSLDVLGDWRSRCVAELGNCREQHYYALAPKSQAPPSCFLAQEVLIYGDEGLILAPPSIEPEAREPWRWLKPPWESPPQAPTPAVWGFIREQISPGVPGAWEVPPWDEIYRVIALHEPVLKALLVPPTNLDKYYADVLHAALAVGLRDRQVFLGLLWHAPHGDARTNGKRWQYLQELLAGELSGPVRTPAVPGPWVGGGASPGSWPAWEPVPEPPAMPVFPLGSLDLALGMEELPRQLQGDQDYEPSPPKFEKTVSGQFFQLLATLGERVIAESCRNEAILSQGTEMEHLAAEIEQCLAPPSRGSGDSKITLRSTGECGPGEAPWLAAIAHQYQATRKLQEVKAMVQDFFSQNPDLAEDGNKVQMVLFSLKNYISINPDSAGLSFRDKLEKAGQMARTFLGQAARSL